MNSPIFTRQPLRLATPGAQSESACHSTFDCSDAIRGAELKLDMSNQCGKKYIELEVD